MPRPSKPAAKKQDSTATIGFEAKLWLTADSRSAAETAEGNRSNNMDAAEASGAKIDEVKWARRQQPKQSNATTRRLAIMNLAIPGNEADIGKEHADTFRNVQHPDLRADYVLANPPFKMIGWWDAKLACVPRILQQIRIEAALSARPNVGI